MLVSFSAGSGARTRDFHIKSMVLYRLSYTCIDDGIGQVGLEPARHYCQGNLSSQRPPFRHKPEVNNRICLIASACGQFLCQLAWQKISLDVCI